MFGYNWHVNPGNLTYQEDTILTSLGSGYEVASHIYRVEYTADDKIKWYIDGVLLRTTIGINPGVIEIILPTYSWDMGKQNIWNYIEIGPL